MSIAMPTRHVALDPKENPAADLKLFMAAPSHSISEGEIKESTEPRVANIPYKRCVKTVTRPRMAMTKAGMATQRACRPLGPRGLSQHIV